jgi:Zn-dependent protease
MSGTQDEARLCPRCGLTYAPSLLACPGCGRLSHSDSLKSLLSASKEAEAAGDWAGALLPLRDAVKLLPEDSQQCRQVQAQLVRLSSLVETDPGRPRKPVQRPKAAPGKQAATGLAAVGALLLKSKVLLLGLLAKGKFLLLLLQGGLPLLSLLGSFGVYWTVWGWKMAALFMVALGVHEIGHVSALKRYGFPASAPMFIPGLGAFVRLRHQPVSAVEDARIGLAGPWWGLGVSVALALAWWLGGWGLFAAGARVSAFINLFNMLPVPPLDGGRAMASLDSEERLVCAALAGGLAMSLNSLLLGGIALLALMRAQGEGASLFGDKRGALEYAFVLGMLTFLAFGLPQANW